MCKKNGKKDGKKWPQNSFFFHFLKTFVISFSSKCCQAIRLQDSLKCLILTKKRLMKLISDLQINIEVFYNLILSFWLCVTRHAQSTQNKKFAYLCNISRKHGDEVDFFPPDKHGSCVQDDHITFVVHSQACPKYPKQQVWNIFAIFHRKHEGWSWYLCCRIMSKVSSNWYCHFRYVWPCMPKLPKITSLQYLKKKANDEVDFLHADKHKRFDTNWYHDFGGNRQTFPKVPIVAMSLQYIKKEVRDEVEFFQIDKDQSFLQIDFNTLGIKVSYKAMLWSQILKLLKYYYNNSKKVRNRFHFLHADKHQSFYILTLSFLMEVARHVQSTQSKKLVIFLKYIKKKLLQLLFWFYCDTKQLYIIIIFYRSPVCCYLFIVQTDYFSDLMLPFQLEQFVLTYFRPTSSPYIPKNVRKHLVSSLFSGG